MSDTFEHIVEGDFVLQLCVLRYGWNDSESFWLPKKVGKVTPKQFYVGEHRYRKSNGNCTTQGDCIAYDTLRIKVLGGDNVDQTLQFNEFRQKLDKFIEIKNLLDTRSIKLSIDNPNISEIYQLVKQIKKLL